MRSDSKIIVGIILVTIAIIGGAIFFLSRPTSTPSVKKEDTKILIREDSQKISSPSASVTLVEFADYQCPACGTYYPLVKQLMGEFAGKINFVYRNFPLDQHKNARITAYAAEASGNQNKFWEMNALLFENQSSWSESKNAKEEIINYAKTLGLNLDTFNKDIDSDAIKQKIERDTQDGFTLGVNSTPTFFLNGEKLQNPASYEDFKTLIKAALLKAPITQAETELYHTHFNLKVVLGSGQSVDFTQNKYQSSEKKELNPDIHFHDGIGDVVHIHKKGVTLGDLFTSLKISFTKDCLTLDTGDKFCAKGAEGGLIMYVNGKTNDQYENYAPADLDRILIVYGEDVAQRLEQLISSVSDTACIYSEKCPERGTPPSEECIGGLGTGCED